MKKKVLFISDGPWTPSGFGTVIKNLVERMKDKYEIGILSWQYVGNAQVIDGIKYFPIGSHNFGKDTLPYVLEDFKPDTIITLGDYWMCGYLAESKYQTLLQNLNIKWFWYLPVDSDVIPIQYLDNNLLRYPDKVIAMSKHGKKTIEKYVDREVDYIPHGTNTSIYKVTNKAKAKELYDYEDKFVIGCVARNQDRKQLPRLLKAFSIFAKGKPDVILHLHCDIRDNMNMITDQSANIRYSSLACAMKTYDIGHKVKFTDKLQSYINGLPVEDMTELYNMMDVHAMSTSGEGFGLPIIDSMACGIPNVMTDYTTAKEFLGENTITGRGLRVSLSAKIYGSFGTERAIVNEQDFADALEVLYNNRPLLHSLGVNAAEFAKDYDWKEIILMWNDIL